MKIHLPFFLPQEAVKSNHFTFVKSLQKRQLFGPVDFASDNT